MQADGGARGGGVRHQEPGGHMVARVGLKGNFMACVSGELFGEQSANVEGKRGGRHREKSHDLLHPGEGFGTG